MPDKTTDFLLLQETLGHIRQAIRILEHLDNLCTTSDVFGESAESLKNAEDALCEGPWYGRCEIPAEVWAVSDDPSCALCGCTQDHACPGGCSWVLPNLCSTCFQALRAAGIEVPAAATIPASSVLGPSSSDSDADLPCPQEFLT